MSTAVETGVAETVKLFSQRYRGTILVSQFTIKI